MTGALWDKRPLLHISVGLVCGNGSGSFETEPASRQHEQRAAASCHQKQTAAALGWGGLFCFGCQQIFSIHQRRQQEKELRVLKSSLNDPVFNLNATLTALMFQAGKKRFRLKLFRLDVSDEITAARPPCRLFIPRILGSCTGIFLNESSSLCRTGNVPNLLVQPGKLRPVAGVTASHSLNVSLFSYGWTV